MAKKGFSLVELMVAVGILALVSGGLVQLFGTSVKAEMAGMNQHEMYAQSRAIENDLKTTLRYSIDNRLGKNSIVFKDSVGQEIKSGDRADADSMEYTSVIFDNARDKNIYHKMKLAWAPASETDGKSKQQLIITREEYDSLDIAATKLKETETRFPKIYEANSAFTSVEGGSGAFPVTVVQDEDSDIHEGMLNIALPFRYRMPAIGEKVNVLMTKVAFSEITESALYPGIVQCGGLLTINNSVGSIDGDLYAASIDDKSWNDHFLTDNYRGAYSGILKTAFESGNSYFAPSGATNITLNSNQTIQVSQGETISYNVRNDGGFYGYLVLGSLRGGSNSTLYLKLKNSISTLSFNNGITGSSDGAPFTIVIDVVGNKTITFNGPIRNNVRIFVNSCASFNINTAVTGKLMVVAQGDLKYESTVNEGFLIADRNVTITSSCNSFKGLIVANDNVTLGSNSYTYSANILNDDTFALDNLVAGK